MVAFTLLNYFICRLESAVLDLVADDSEGLQKQKSRYHWDKRGKKYVKLNNGERVTASGKVLFTANTICACLSGCSLPFSSTFQAYWFKLNWMLSLSVSCRSGQLTFILFCCLQVKTESGAKVKTEKTGIYKKWKERSHKKVYLKGTTNGENGEATTISSGDYWSRGNGRNLRGNKKSQHSVPNAHVRSEIKDFDQVRKGRQKKANNKLSYMKGKANKKKGKNFGKSGKRGKSK
ncbi:Dead box ATP-dependent RNA helicase isoform 1 [Gossypium australe]|uniref:Dead box ATP-dependent RNA helicase isoform 1 n=1 Tax=Gossypium australe TaxID=47621 RepID=A0A5B6WUM8_9ROSI|nr:Dead box ATP-dependent RNA helicase isoform 1 [Gossypium australe]